MSQMSTAAGGVSMAQLDARTFFTVSRGTGAAYVCDGGNDHVQIQQAINDAIAAGGGTVLIRSGDYFVNATITIAGNVDGLRIIGEGMGITNLIAAATMTGSDPIIAAGNGPIGADLPLTAATVAGVASFTITTANASTLDVGDWILLKSNKIADSEGGSKFCGELKQVELRSGGTITTTDVVFDAYTLPDSGAAIKLNMVKNVILQDLSVTSLALTSSLSTGFLDFRFCENLQVLGVEMHHAWHSMQLRSIINSRVEGCYIHHINEPTAGSNLRYGIWVASATQSTVIANCRMRHLRHAVTFGTTSGSNGNGIQRAVTVTGCLSTEADTAHFDTHQPCDGVTFVGNSAIGGRPWQNLVQSVIGYQSRGRNVSFVGNMAQDIPGRGFMAFGPAADNTRFVGNTASSIRQRNGGGEGFGFYLDSAGSNKHVLTNNVAVGCSSAGIFGAGGNDNCVLIGNVVDNCAREISNSGVKFGSALRGIFANNQVLNTRTGAPLSTTGTSDLWQVKDNTFFGNLSNTPVLVGTKNVVSGNITT